MILEEIKFDDTSEGKREAIMNNLGQQVILKDFHKSWCHGKIREIGYICLKIPSCSAHNDN